MQTSWTIILTPDGQIEVLVHLFRLIWAHKRLFAELDIAWYRGNVRENNFVISVSNDRNGFAPVVREWNNSIG